MAGREPETKKSDASQKVVITDTRNLLVMWLEEKLARRELTVEQADKMLHEQDTQGKLWIGPVKDGLGGSSVLYKLAHDFASWKGARVYFSKSKAGHDLVTFKGWPAGRKLISGTRYRLDNPKIVELQIGKTGLRAAGRESARFGIYIVVAADIVDFVANDRATLGQLLGNLTVDVPSVLIASAIGTAAASAVATTTVAGLAVIGSFAIGPLIVGFAVGVAVGYALYRIDEHFHFSEQLGRAYDKGLARLVEVWHRLGADAEQRYRQLATSTFVHDLRQDARTLAAEIERQTSVVRGEFIPAW